MTSAAVSGRPERSRALRGHAAMLAFSALVAGSFSLGSLAAGEIAPVALNAARFLIATFIFAGLTLAIGARSYRASDFRAPWRYLVVGGLYGGYFVAMFEALKIAEPVSTGAVFTLTPLMTALLAWPLLGQRLRPWIASALAVGAVGAVWVIFDGSLERVLSFSLGRGETIFLIGCFCHAAFTPLLKLFNRGEPPFVSLSLTMLAGMVVLLVWGWEDIRAVEWSALPAIVWIVLAYLAIGTTFLTSSFLYYAAQHLPSSKVMAYTYLTPAWIILWELVLGHDGPNLLILPGMALIILALVMLLREE